MPAHDMTEAEFDRLCDFTRETASKLGLRDWTLWISRERFPKAKGIAADFTAIFGRKHAKIRFCRNFRRLDEPEVTVAHECIHAHFNELDALCRDAARQMPKGAAKLFLETWDRQMELAVDALAEAWALNSKERIWEIEEKGEDAGVEKAGVSEEDRPDAKP